MKVLYVSDLDGTLLDTADRLPDWTVNTLNRLVREGMLFTYATARSLSSSSVVTSGLQLQLPVIVYNGAFLMDPMNRRVISSAAFSPEFREEMRGFLHGQPLPILVYSFLDGVERVSWILGRENEAVRHYLESRRDDPRLRGVRSEEELFAGEIFYYTFLGKREELAAMRDRFSGREDCNCIFQRELYREEYWCEIMPPEASKASGILRLKNLLGADRVVSFGDAANDIPMFQVSDECYAVGGAIPELRALADGVLLPSGESSVAKWLEARWRQEG